MAHRKGNYRGTFNRCERPGCHVPAAKWSVYSDRMLCNACLSFERAAYAEQEQPVADAMYAQAGYTEDEVTAMEAEYADERGTVRDLRQGAVQ